MIDAGIGLLTNAAKARDPDQSRFVPNACSLSLSSPLLSSAITMVKLWEQALPVLLSSSMITAHLWEAPPLLPTAPSRLRPLKDLDKALIQ